MQQYTDLDLESMLKSLSLKAFAKHYQQLAESAEKAGMTCTEFLKQLAGLELELRNQRRKDNLLRLATLPRSKFLKDFDILRINGLSPSLIQRLANGDFIDHYENILIFGNPGTGKTHLSIGLAREWCIRGRRILFRTAAALVQELLAAKKALILNDLIKKLDRFEVLVIDDISYMPYERQETDVLFVLLAERYEKRSVIITSNLVFSQWQQIFKDEMTTAAMIDRLIHHATILELNSESYRTKQAKIKQGQPVEPLIKNLDNIERIEDNKEADHTENID